MRRPWLALPALLLSLALSPDSLAASPRKAPRKKPPAEAPVQFSPLRVHSLSQLPAQRWLDLQASGPATTPATEANDACGASHAGRIAPCLGLQSPPRHSDVRIRFELARSISGAPQSVLFSPCPGQGSPCSNAAADLQTDQAKLADMLNQGKRTPQANLGLELSF